MNLDGIETDAPVARKHDTRPGCLVGKAARNLTPEDRARFVSWVDGWDGSNVELAARLTARGLPITEKRIGDHRLSRCACRDVGLWP